MGLLVLGRRQETCIIPDSQAAFEKFNVVLNSAEKEILVVTSSEGVLNWLKQKSLLEKWRGKGVSVKIMAPIITKNLKSAKMLSKCSLVRHIPVFYSRLTLVDGKYLFRFMVPQENLEGMEHFENVVYCDDLVLVQRTSDLLHALWDDSFEISRVTVGSIAREPVPTASLSTHVSEVAKIMAKQNVGSVVIARDFEPLGIITEKDIVERVVLAKKDLNEVVAQEIMTAPLLTIDSNRTIEKALGIMHKNNLRRLVVVKGEKMVGLVTERRLLLSRVSMSDPE